MDHFSTVFKGERAPIFPGSTYNHEQEDESYKSTFDNNDNAIPENKYEDLVCSPFSMTELQSILSELPNEKSCGVDHIPNEFLKNCGFELKQYILKFYNKILQEGKIPSALNVGKCCLVYKVFQNSF